MSTKWNWVVFVFLILVFCGIFLPVQAENTSADTGFLYETPNYQFHSLTLDDHYAVWIAGRSGETYRSLRLYNLSSLREEIIERSPRFSTSDGMDITDHPAISGNLLVWENNNDIHLYNLSNHTEIPLTAVFTAERFEDQRSSQFPDIYQDCVVWAEQLPQQSNQWKRQIILYNLTMGKKTRISPTDYDQIYPDIAGNSLVWLDYRHGRQLPSLYLYNIATGEEKEISREAVGSEPFTDGKTIVWSALQGTTSRGVVYTISTGVTRDIAPDSVSEQVFPQVSGKRIIWLQNLPAWIDPDGKNGLFQSDMSTGDTYQFKTTDMDIIDPRIDGNRIVYGQLFEETNIPTTGKSHGYMFRLHMIMLRNSTNTSSGGYFSVNPESPSPRTSQNIEHNFSQSQETPSHPMSGFDIIPGIIGLVFGGITNMSRENTLLAQIYLSDSGTVVVRDMLPVIEENDLNRGSCKPDLQNLTPVAVTTLLWGA
jgi:beta propeller repeat protein